MNRIDIFPWDDNFNTGLPKIDEQHRRLVELLNRLASQFAFEADQVELDAIFEELLAYTVYHFETEEGIWREHLPPDPRLLAHEKTHSTFIDEINRFIEDGRRGDIHEVAEEALDFLVRWLASHILESDRHMAYVVQGLQEGLSHDEAKARAAERMSGFTRQMIDIVLSIYGTLSHNTLRLMRELVHQKHVETELAAARQEAERNSRVSQDAQADLMRQRSFLKTLVNNLPDLVWLKDPDGIYLACNRRFEQFFGAEEKDIVGKDDDAFMSDELVAFSRDHDRQVVENASPTFTEQRLTFACDGHEELLEITKTPMFDAHGELVGVLGIGHDITRNRFLQQEVEEERDRSQRYLDTVETIIVSLDSEGMITMINRKGCEVIGYAEHELLGKQWFDKCLPQPEGLETVYQVFVDIMQGKLESAEYFENEIVTRDGDRRLIAWHNAYFRNAKGEITGTLSAGDDITARRETEEHLRLAASVFEHADEGIVITEADGSIIDVNQAFSRITGYAREAVIGQTPRLLKSGKHPAEFYEEMWRLLLIEGSWSGEIWNKHKTGKVYAEKLTISAVKDDQGDIQRFVGLFTDITALKQQQEQLEHMAHYDVLTGLPNRVLLGDRLYQGMVQTQRRGTVLAVVYLDLDGFKTINDAHGHETGDQFLVGLAAHMKQALREGDTLARLGGDEFVAVLLDLPGHEDCVTVLDRLLDAVAEPVEVGGLSLSVSASAGVTFFPGEENMDADQLLRQADQAMYQAKQSGRNRYHLFDAEQERKVRGRNESIDRLRTALADGEMLLHYQPKVNMRDGEVSGVEALIRWNHPKQGLLSSGEFLPILEGHSLGLELGDWVLDQALDQLDAWRQRGITLGISVNVDAVHLQQHDFAQRLREKLAAHPSIAAGDLQLEVLETNAMQDMDRVSEVMRACRDMGVGFALDDFGTGYSSLTYLKRLPANLIKIDQSFVRDMLEDPDDLAILNGVIGMAKAFHLPVIAEGVETLAQGVMLLQLGCELAQGFAIARPMPAEQIPEWLEQWSPHPSWLKRSPVHREDQSLLLGVVEHRGWVTNLKAYLRREQPSPPEMDFESCNFAAWLERYGREKYLNVPELKEIEAIHEALHRKASELVNAMGELDQSAMETGIGRIERLSGDLSARMFDLVA